MLIPNKHTRLFLILLILLTFQVVCLSTDNNFDPVINNGIIDLRSWDIKTSIKLSGEWKFKWNVDDLQFSQIDYYDSDWQLIKVPGFWNALTGTGHGIGWLRLKIYIEKQDELGIFIESALSAYELYVNGEKIISRGKVGSDKDHSSPQVFKSLERLPKAKDGEIVIAWRISNYNCSNGGPESIPVIGLYNNEKNKFHNNDIKNAIVIGIILMMCFYNLILFLGRRTDKSLLFFSLFCLVLSVRLFFLEEIFDSIFPSLSPLIFDIRYRIDFVSAPLLVMTLSNFFSSFLNFKKEYQKLVIRFILVFFTILAILPIFLPVNSFTKIALVYNLALIIGGMALIVFIIISIIEKKKFSKILIAGTIVLFLTLINDILHAQRIIYTTFLLYNGFIFFLFSQTTVLSLHYSTALSTSEYLSQNLQQEVISRTNEINSIMQQRTMFFINLAHETKTPLTLISNYLDKYLKNHDDKDLLIIKQNFEKLKKDMVNFLDTEKIERNQFSYNHEQICNLSKLVLEKSFIFMETILQKNIKFDRKIADNIFIKADSFAIDRVLNNLLDNAVKYTEAGGVITITLSQEEDLAKLKIADTGIGISEEQKDHIFLPFYQLSHKKHNIQGLGMGLYITKKILDDLYAHIVLESEVGRGSEFNVLFKRHGKKSDELIGSNLELLKPTNNIFVTNTELVSKKYDPDKKTILIVEDNLQLVANLKNNFEKIYNVYFNTDGKAALSRLETLPLPNIIISDIMMDTMDGYEFRKNILNIKKYRVIPFIFLTAKSSKDERHLGLSQGAIDYISKPFELQELKEKIKNWLFLMDLKFLHADTQIDSKHQRRFADFIKHFNIFPKEEELLRYLLKGYKNSQIAIKMCISSNTVRKHIERIKEKLEVTKKEELLPYLFKYVYK